MAPASKSLLMNLIRKPLSVSSCASKEKLSVSNACINREGKMSLKPNTEKKGGYNCKHLSPGEYMEFVDSITPRMISPSAPAWKQYEQLNARELRFLRNFERFRPETFRSLPSSLDARQFFHDKYKPTKEQLEDYKKRKE